MTTASSTAPGNEPTPTSIWISNEAEKIYGKHDVQYIVIDEVAGLLVAAFLVPFRWPEVVTTFLLFRLFDMTKPGPIRWLDIAAPVTRLAQATPYLLRGKPARWMAAAGYSSGRASRIELALDSPLVMDGEIFLTSGSGPLTLSATEEITFIAL